MSSVVRTMAEAQEALDAAEKEAMKLVGSHSRALMRIAELEAELARLKEPPLYRQIRLERERADKVFGDCTESAEDGNNG